MGFSQECYYVDAYSFSSFLLAFLKDQRNLFQLYTHLALSQNFNNYWKKGGKTIMRNRTSKNEVQKGKFYSFKRHQPLPLGIKSRFFKSTMSCIKYYQPLKRTAPTMNWWPFQISLQYIDTDII